MKINMVKLYLTLLLVFIQPNAEASSNPLNPQTMEQGMLGKLWEYLTDNVYLVVAFIIIMAIMEGLRFGYNKITKKHRMLHAIKAFFGFGNHPNLLQNNVVFAGIGGSGKTTLINAISDPTKVGEDKETESYAAIKHSFTKGDSIYRFTLFDYRGQNTGTLARGIKDNSSGDTKQLHSLVFVVDLIHPDTKSRDSNAERFDSYVKKRINQHIEEWNDSTLNTVFGFFEKEELKYVCLFVNTVDRLKDNGASLRDSIRADMKPLIDRLKKRCGYTDNDDNYGEGFSKFSIFFGSAHNGLSVNSLKAELIEHSFVE